jgi:hypothetical protein
VGKNGQVLLEIKLKDIRYKRCTINGVEHGGLGATGFTLVETGSGTGVFEGVFKMPSKICNKSGTELISSAGGSFDAKYYDSVDSFGNPSVYSLLKNKQTKSASSLPSLSSYDIVKPSFGKIEEIVLSGTIGGHKKGDPLTVIITSPGDTSHNFDTKLTSDGHYRSILSFNENSLAGVYQIELFHSNLYKHVIIFEVSDPKIPDWVKNNAENWSSGHASDSKFIDGLRYLVDAGFLTQPGDFNSIYEKELPDWVKNNAKWWYDEKISDEDFIKSVQYLIKKGMVRV